MTRRQKAALEESIGQQVQAVFAAAVPGARQTLDAESVQLAQELGLDAVLASSAPGESTSSPCTVVGAGDPVGDQEEVWWIPCYHGEVARIPVRHKG